MARKHRKSGITKSPVQETVVERKVALNRETNEYEVQPVVQRGRALRSTTNRGKRNHAHKGGRNAS